MSLLKKGIILKRFDNDDDDNIIAMMIIFVSDNGINYNISLTIDSCGTDRCACFFDMTCSVSDLEIKKHTMFPWKQISLQIYPSAPSCSKSG